jgi:hypothetical protein
MQRPHLEIHQKNGPAFSQKMLRKLWQMSIVKRQLPAWTMSHGGVHVWADLETPWSRQNPTHFS